MERKGTTAADAERKLAAALRDRLTPAEGISADTRLTALADVWWEEFEAKGRAVGTARQYRTMLAAHILPGLGGVTIREATVSRLDRFVKALAKNAGYGAARTSAVVLSGMLDVAARHGAIAANPMRSVASVVVPERVIRAHTVGQVGELRAILRAWDATLDKAGRRRSVELADVVDMYLATGCRTGEILALQWPDVDLGSTPPTLTISGTFAKDKDGKGHIQASPKSESSHRRLMLPPFAVEMLIRRRLESSTVLVFPSATGTLRDPNNFLAQWHRALAGTVFEGSVPKTLRSSVATLVKEQADAEQAKDQLGHSSVKVTEAHYIKPSHVAPDLTGILETFNVLPSE